jgi:hypothetical protein
MPDPQTTRNRNNRQRKALGQTVLQSVVVGPQFVEAMRRKAVLEGVPPEEADKLIADKKWLARHLGKLADEWALK